MGGGLAVNPPSPERYGKRYERRVWTICSRCGDVRIFLYRVASDSGGHTGRRSRC
jgi:hypothetical protein